MSISVKAQRDYLLTEASIDLPPERDDQGKLLTDLDYLMKASRSTGKIVAVYSDGFLHGINVEQKSKIHGEAVADKVRELVGVVDRELNGNHR